MRTRVYCWQPAIRVRPCVPGTAAGVGKSFTPGLRVILNRWFMIRGTTHSSPLDRAECCYDRPMPEPAGRVCVPTLTVSSMLSCRYLEQVYWLPPVSKVG